jgi:Tfp pilus assembly protein PilO
MVFLVLLLGCYYYYNYVILPQPKKIEALNEQIQEKNKQLLAAQILAEKREGITQLIKNNLIESPNDSLAEKSSVPFLRYLTAKMDQLGIRLVSLTPLDVIGMQDPTGLETREYLSVPYEMKILANYEEWSKFLDVLEKNPRLIKVSNFIVSNDLEQTSYQEDIEGKPRQHPINLQVTTIAILKASFRSEQG